MTSIRSKAKSAAALMTLVGALSAFPVRAEIWNLMEPYADVGVNSNKIVNFSATTSLRAPAWVIMPNGAKALGVQLTSHSGSSSMGDCWEIKTYETGSTPVDTRIWIYRNGGYESINDNGRPGYLGRSIARFWLESTMSLPVSQYVYVAVQNTSHNNAAFTIRKEWLGSGALGNCMPSEGFSTVKNKNGALTLSNTN